MHCPRLMRTLSLEEFVRNLGSRLGSNPWLGSYLQRCSWLRSSLRNPRHSPMPPGCKACLSARFRGWPWSFHIRRSVATEGSHHLMHRKHPEAGGYFRFAQILALVVYTPWIPWWVVAALLLPFFSRAIQTLGVPRALSKRLQHSGSQVLVWCCLECQWPIHRSYHHSLVPTYTRRT